MKRITVLAFLTLFYETFGSGAHRSALLTPLPIWPQRIQPQPRQRHFDLSVLKSSPSGKGFGKTPPPAPDKKTAQPPLSPVATSPEESPPPISTTAGAELLTKLRAQREEDLAKADERYAELSKVQEALKENPTAGVIPEAVANRMLKRMLTLAAPPIFGGIGLFVVFYISATQWDTDVAPPIVAAATTVPWLLGLAGLTYGVLSASWDPEVEGSALGLDEFKENLKIIGAGVMRSGQDSDFREQYEYQQRKNNAPANREQRRQDEKTLK